MTKRLLESIRRKNWHLRFAGEDELKLMIELVYRVSLGRRPDPRGQAQYLERLRSGMSLTNLVQEVAQSQEAQRRKRLVRDATALADPSQCLIMGTGKLLNKEIWETRRNAIGGVVGRSRRPLVPLAERKFKHSGQIQISAIASLYKGQRFLRAFLDNITSQSIFDRSELIIIDANSPDGESALIGEYGKVYPNIVYKRINYRIGIYDAWNLGVELAKGRFLTTTNLDDLRRTDSFELQEQALNSQGGVNIVYQDFYYSLDSDLPFDDVVKMGFRSDLPDVTFRNLLEFNSPHCAPMWRKELHETVGLFDASFKAAGDWDFWIRCALAGARFHKLTAASIAYFQNPDGLSTSTETRGPVIEEEARIYSKYLHFLDC